MQLRHLKPLRMVIAAAFFVLIAFIFLDYRALGAQAMAREVLYLQFVPSLLKFLNSAAIGAAGFIVVLVLTLLFGRVYCSTICPLGTLQDLIGRLARKLRPSRGKKQKRPNFTFSRPQNSFRYTLLSLTALFFLTGSGLLLNLLDPFSSFGRILSNLMLPLVLSLNNLGVQVAEGLGSHLLYRVQWPLIDPVSVGLSLTMLTLVGWLCVRHGRLYCNTLCPVGALLGLFARFSLFRIEIDPDSCMDCRLCEGECKAGCIDLQEKRVDLSRCVACYNCLAACPGQGLRIAKHWSRPAPRSLPESGRRRFMIGLAAGGMGLVADRVEAGPSGQIVQNRPTTIPEKRTSPLSPPGSVSIARFTSTCTACHLCVSICPSRVIVPSFLGYGFSGLMQPQLVFQSGHCNYECTACTKVCPSGAILPLSKDEKRRTQIGVAQFIKENCVVYTDNTNCGACSEHCPTKAVHMVPYLKATGRKLFIPEMNPDICVGCGGCEYACPTKPYKAIYVDGNPKHLQAEEPSETKVEQTIDSSEDFPF